MVLKGIILSLKINNSNNNSTTIIRMDISQNIFMPRSKPLGIVHVEYKKEAER